jgi:hypothetical protein
MFNSHSENDQSMENGAIPFNQNGASVPPAVEQNGSLPPVLAGPVQQPQQQQQALQPKTQVDPATSEALHLIWSV